MVPAFLAELRSRGIDVSADGDRLRCAAPTGALTPQLRHKLQQCKREILDFLRSAEALAQQQRAIVPLEPRGTRAPVFAVGGHNGDVFCYRALARYLGEDQPFFGLEPPGLDGRTEPFTRVEDLAAFFADQIRSFRPSSPYIILGFCAGGSVAYELGRQLVQGGAAVEFVGLLGSPDPRWFSWPSQLARRLGQQRERVSQHARALGSLSVADLCRYVSEKLDARKAQRAAADAAALDPVLIRRAVLERVTLVAVRRYAPRGFAGRVDLFLPCGEWLPSATRRWRSVAPSGEEYVWPAGCSVDSMLLEPQAAGFAELFRRCRDGIGPIPLPGSDPKRPLPLLAYRPTD